MILVTGSSGFVGSHLVAALARRFPGEPIAAADAAPPPPSVMDFWGRAPVTVHALDVTDRAGVNRLVADLRPTRVVHAAAMTPTPAVEAASPQRIVDVNLGGTLNLLEAATASPGIQRVIVLSSTAVYVGDDLPEPITEEAPGRAPTLYATTKLACENLARRYGALRGVSTAAVRVGPAYGAMERPTHHRERMSQIHPLLAGLREGRPVRVAESDARRDFVHADDVGDAVAALLGARSLRHDVYNVGSGTAPRWSEVLAAFRSAGLATLEVAPGEAEAWLDPALDRPALSVERLAADSGFRPRRSFADAVVLIVPEPA